jgi:hypothetical protein
VQRKAQKDQADNTLKAQELQVELQRIATQKEIALSQQQVLQKQADDRVALDSKRLTVDTLKNAAVIKGKQEYEDKQLKVSTLHNAAKIVAEKDQHQNSMLHEAYQNMLERQHNDKEQLIDDSHEAYQNMLDREHKSHQDQLNKHHEAGKAAFDLGKEMFNGSVESKGN